MKKILLMIYIFTISQLFSITLEDLEKSLEANYPNFKNSDLYDKITEIEEQKILSYLFPQFSLIGSFSDQSETMELPISSALFQIPETDTQRKQIVLNIDQILYDSGVNHQRRELSNLKMEIENDENVIKLESLKEKLFSLYFAALFQKEKLEIKQNLLNNLNERKKTAIKSKEVGILQEKDIYLLESEIIKVEQDILEAESGLADVYKKISILTGESLAVGIDFEKPEFTEKHSYRKEYDLFKSRILLLDENSTLYSKLKLPKLVANAQIGYGNPGLNIFDNEWNDFYKYSINFKWDIWNWRRYHSEQEILKVRKKILENEESAFSKNLEMRKNESIEKIKKITAMLENDRKILDLRLKIQKITNSQFDNGIATSIDVIDDNTAVANTQISLRLRELQLLYEKLYNKKYIGEIR